MRAEDQKHVDVLADTVNKVVVNALRPFVATKLPRSQAMRLRIVMIAILAHRINLLIGGAETPAAKARLTRLARDTVEGKV